ncbi:hypothetical protein HAX54_038794 [Datura stramonium]|uniref:Uncharacterized protein n=1 Tax=Datura stramonium TaxID=4076 RepID=A0ABS8VLY2_DATST|nr:hypothetical protein [Datura stramonium]
MTIKANFSLGHFHERPIMPGFLMDEIGEVLNFPELLLPRCWLGYACNLRQRFRKPVVAGDILTMRMTLIKLQKQFGVAKMEGMAYVIGDAVCEGAFLTATGIE